MKNLFSSTTPPEHLNVKIGEEAPDFTLFNHSGEEWKLSRQRGKVLALLFYPQNETLVCNRQLCSLRDNWQNYLKTKADIIGISPNSINNHSEFARKYNLPLPILADENRAVTKIFCYHKIFPSNFMRSIVVVDADGIIRYNRTMLRAVRPSDHSVIAAIYAARADEICKNYKSIAERLQSMLEYRF